MAGKCLAVVSEAGVRVRPWAKWLFWLAVAATLVMALMPHPPRMILEPSDKVEHAIVFVTLTILALLAFPERKPLWILAGLALFGAMIEVAQAIPVLHRDSDVVDWLADIVATAFVLLIALIYRQSGKK